MRVYRYPPRSVAGDYLRTLAGMGVGLGVLLSTPATPAIILIFGSVTCLFGYFGYRTVRRHLTRVAVTDSEIRDAGFGTRIMPWGDLQRLKLRYYGTKRQAHGRGGFMQLTLKANGKSLTFYSSLDGFDYITWRAAKALRENGGTMDPASAGNLLTMGLDADREMPPPDPSGSVYR